MAQRSDTLDLLSAHHLNLLEDSRATITSDKPWQLVVVKKHFLLNLLLLPHQALLTIRPLPALLLQGEEKA